PPNTNSTWTPSSGRSKRRFRPPRETTPSIRECPSSAHSTLTNREQKLNNSRRSRRRLDSSGSIQERRRDRNQTRHKDRVNKQDCLRTTNRKGRSTTSRRRRSKNRHPRRI